MAKFELPPGAFVRDRYVYLSRIARKLQRLRDAGDFPEGWAYLRHERLTLMLDVEVLRPFAAVLSFDPGPVNVRGVYRAYLFEDSEAAVRFWADASGAPLQLELPRFGADAH